MIAKAQIAAVDGKTATIGAGLGCARCCNTWTTITVEHIDGQWTATGSIRYWIS